MQKLTAKEEEVMELMWKLGEYQAELAKLE